MIIVDGKVSSAQLAGVAVIFLTMAVWGCAASPAAGGPAASNASPASDQPGASRPTFDVSGVWDGRSVASCNSFNPMAFNTRCNAINTIALTLVQNDDKITGFYKCSIGNMDCRNQNDSGTIANGSMSNQRLALRIAMPDGSSCLFNGMPTAANQIRGSYTCYQGGGLAEQGRFEVGRNY